MTAKIDSILLIIFSTKKNFHHVAKSFVRNELGIHTMEWFFCYLFMPQNISDTKYSNPVYKKFGCSSFLACKCLKSYHLIVCGFDLTLVK